METTSTKRSFSKVIAVLLAALMLVSVLPMSAMAAGSIDYDRLFNKMDASDVTDVVVTNVHTKDTYFENELFVYGWDFDVTVDVTCKVGNGETYVYEDVSDYEDLARLGIYFVPADGTKMNVMDHDETLLKVFYGADIEAKYDYDDVKKDTDETFVEADRHINVEPSRVFYSEIEKNLVRDGVWYVIANGEEALLHDMSEVEFAKLSNGKSLKADTLENETIVINDEMIDFDYPVGYDIKWKVADADVEDENGVHGYYVYYVSFVDGVPYANFLSLETILNENAPEAFDGTVSPVVIKSFPFDANDVTDPDQIVIPAEVFADFCARTGHYGLWFIEQAKEGKVYANYAGGIEYTDYIDVDCDHKKGDEEPEEVEATAIYYNEKFYLYFDKTTDTFKAMWDGDTNREITFTVVDEKSPYKNKEFYVDENSEIQRLTDEVEETFFDVTNTAQKKAWQALEATDAMDFSFYCKQEAEITSIKVVEQPNLVYNEGDRITVADISSLVVDIYFNGGLYVKRIPFRHFEAYNIEVKLEPTFSFGLDKDGKNGLGVIYSYPLSYAYDNNAYFTVGCADHAFYDATDKITVLKSAVDYYEIADKLANGEYVIVTKASGEPDFDALTLTTNKSDVQLTTRVYGVSKPVVSVYDYLNASYAKLVNDRIDTDWCMVGTDSVWSLVKNANGWYIMNNEGEYLSRYDYDVIEKALRTYGALPLTTVSEITDPELVTWQLSGSKNGYIYSEGTKEQISYYIALDDLSDLFGQATHKLGMDTEKAEDITDTDDVDAYYVVAVPFGTAIPGYVDTFTFYGVHYSKVASVEVYTQPTLTYNSGDALDLSDLAIKVTYANGAVKYIKYANFAANNVTVNYANGATLTTSADNGKSVVVTYEGKSGASKALTVSASNVTAKVERLAGATRLETAVAISEAWTSAETVVVANGWSNVDALAAATLAAKLDAPILLATANDASVAAAQAKVLGAKNVIVVGGTAAISDAALKAFDGMKVERIAGDNRIATSVAIANKIGSYNDVFVVGMNNSADALTAGAVAAVKGAPIVYVGAALTDDVKAVITGKNVVILGGTAAVSNAVETEIKAVATSVERIAGAHRYETSAKINAKYADLFTSNNVAVALGADGRFCDALAGSVFAAKKGMPVVLVDNGYANADAYAFVSSIDVDTLYVFGGDQAVADATVDAILGK